MASMASSTQANGLRGCALTNAALPSTTNKLARNVCMAPSLASASSAFYSNSKRLHVACSLPRKSSTGSSSFRSVLETPNAAEEAVKTIDETVTTTPEAVTEGVEAVKDTVVEAVEGVATGKLTRTRSFHKPRGGNIKADPLRVIMFQVPNIKLHYVSAPMFH